MACRIAAKESCSSQLFRGGPKPGCSDRLGVEIIESHNFFVLGPIPVKFHIRARLIESFPAILRTWWCAAEKLHFTPFHTLHQLKRDEARFHHLGESQSFAGLAVFRGRLRAFGKCPNGVAFSKGMPNLASVRLTL